MNLQPGFWQHYKRDDTISAEHGRYFVVGVGQHTENEEELVCYFPLYNDEHKGIVRGVLSFRPFSMWHEVVEYKGRDVVRFFKIIDPEVVHEMTAVVYFELPQFYAFVAISEEQSLNY
jgi:hypothetical protein